MRGYGSSLGIFWKCGLRDFVYTLLTGVRCFSVDTILFIKAIHTVWSQMWDDYEYLVHGFDYVMRALESACKIMNHAELLFFVGNAEIIYT